MDNGTLLFVPVGGLANRMRAVASACNLAQRTGVGLSVVWFRDWALRARFADCFKPVEGLNLREATWRDELLLDRPRRHNLYLPWLPLHIAFGQRIDEHDVDRLKAEGFDFEGWARGHRSWMSCYSVFGEFSDALYAQLFQPVDDVLRQVEANAAKFSAHTIGLHIRRTDNIDSIRLSPTRLFTDAADREIDAHSDTRIYLATDDEPTKAELRRRYGDRVITPAVPAARNSASGIQGGLIDMYTLARTAVIYGSAASSFSRMASKLGAARLIVLQQ